MKTTLTKKTVLLGLIIFLIGSLPKKTKAQTTLSAGDIIFTAYDSSPSSSSDKFSFVLLKAIDSDTKIYFTDRGYFGGSSWQVDNGSSETSVSWTAKAAMAVGTEVTITSLTASAGSVASLSGSSNGLSLSNVGDQIIAFQGSTNPTSGATMIAGIHWFYCPSGAKTTIAGWDIGSCGTGPNFSAMPQGLTGGTSAFWIGKSETGAVYPQGSFKGTGAPFSSITDLRTAVMNSENWFKSTSTSSDPSVPVPTGVNYYSSASSTLTSITRVSSINTKENSVDFTVTFNATVTGVSTSNFSLSTTGVTGASITGISGTGSTRTVSVNTGSGSGTVKLNLANSTNISPSLSTTLPYTSGESYTIDKTAPTANIVVAKSTMKAGETSLVTITFSESVSGFSNADLTIENGTLSTLSSSDEGITWTATLTPTGNINDATNVITLNLSGVADQLGNIGLGSLNSNNYAINTVRPTLSITSTASSPTAIATIPIKVTLSESVTGFTQSDLTVTNGNISDFSESGKDYTFNVTATANGIVTIDVAANSMFSIAGNGNTAAIQFSITYFNSLPVNLISFTAKAEGNFTKLIWYTSSENSNKHFELEKSIDGKNFILLGQVDAASNPSIKNSYSYVDYSPANGINYYRLTQVDQDGQSVDLATRTVTFSIAAFDGISVYPNPAIADLYVSFPTGMQKVEVINIKGNIIKKFELNQSDMKLNIKIADFEPGNYILRFYKDLTVITKKFIKL